MTREMYYEMLVTSMSADRFYQYFGEYPVDIQDFDYSFDKVHWNMSFEYAYNEYLLEEE